MLVAIWRGFQTSPLSCLYKTICLAQAPSWDLWGAWWSWKDTAMCDNLIPQYYPHILPVAALLGSSRKEGRSSSWEDGQLCGCPSSWGGVGGQFQALCGHPIFITPCTPSSHSLSLLPALEWSLLEAGAGETCLCHPCSAWLGAGDTLGAGDIPGAVLGNAAHGSWGLPQPGLCKSQQMWFRKLQLRGTLALQMASEEICTSVDVRKNGVFKVKMEWKPAFPLPPPAKQRLQSGASVLRYLKHTDVLLSASSALLFFSLLLFPLFSLCLESIPRQLSAPLVTWRV